jgi:hypothetical protein
MTTKMKMTPEEQEAVTDEVWRTLIETGCLVFSGYDHQGEPTYRVTERCREFFPELFEMHQSDVNATAFELWKLGVIDITFTENSESIGISPANYARLREVSHLLDDDQIAFIRTLQKD